MDWMRIAFMTIILAAAVMSVFGRTFRVRLLSLWITSLTLAYLFLLLQNEILTFTLCLVSTFVVWVMIVQTLVFGDFQRPRTSPASWRTHIMPITGALMFLAMIYLATPAGILENPSFPEPSHLPLADLGREALGRFPIFAVIVSAVAFGAVVGVGMIARASWRGEKEGF